MNVTPSSLVSLCDYSSVGLNDTLETQPKRDPNTKPCLLWRLSYEIQMSQFLLFFYIHINNHLVLFVKLHFDNKIKFKLIFCNRVIIWNFFCRPISMSNKNQNFKTNVHHQENQGKFTLFSRVTQWYIHIDFYRYLAYKFISY